ncbi:MAG TPA: hypothetical protein VD816_06785 [Ohtaekwangia sp.]|nr:hypothetical protein [Ohtaekwangia sp.]
MNPRTLVVLLSLTLSSAVFAQTPDSPVAYMQYLSDRDLQMSQKYLSYMSEVAHGNRARKMEKRRQELINEIRQSLGEAGRLKPFKGDASLRDAYKSYWDILLKVFNEDYHKIVNMEEIAEQSYDNMEAYLLAQEKAEEVLDAEAEKIHPVYESFAAKNNIRLIEKDSKLSQKLRQVGAVNSYYHHLYLIFFKAHKQEAYMLDAFNKGNVNATEQNRTTLIRFADEGLQKLDTIKPFKGDGSLVNNCRKVLEFHKNEAEVHMPVQSAFLLKKSEFEKIRKAMESKPAAKRTQSDIDNYNNAVKEFNDAVNSSNASLQAVNSGREKTLTNWDNAVKRFMELHVPKGVPKK